MGSPPPCSYMPRGGELAISPCIGNQAVCLRSKTVREEGTRLLSILVLTVRNVPCILSFDFVRRYARRRRVMESEQRGRVPPGKLTRVLLPGDRRSMSRTATRAIDVLEYFGQVRRPLRAIEIAHALNLSPSTTNQLLKTMVESAHLTFDASAKCYLPSPRLARFSAWMVTNYGIGERLQTLISETQQASGEIVTLTTPNDIFMQIIDLAGTADALGVAVRGLKISIFGSTIGTAYLSSLPVSQITKLAVRARVSSDELANILREVECVRQDGVGDGPSSEGANWSVAAPLHTHNALTPLVLGLSGPTHRIQRNLGPLRELIRTVTAPRVPVSTG